MKNIFCFLVLASLTASCSSDNNLPADGPNLITKNDFEALAGWGGVDPATLSKVRAHSGKYSLEVHPPDRDYSITYDAALGQVSPRKVKKIRLDAWVFLTSAKASGMLVMQVKDPAQADKNIFWDGIKLTETVKEYNKWVKVSKEFTLPETIAYTNHVQLFLWRGDASEPVYADDISLTTEE